MFNQYDFDLTLDEGCVAIAHLGGNVWLGAVSQYLDFCDGEEHCDKPFLAFFAVVNADDFREAEDRLNECTDLDVIHSVGWFRTHDGGALALAEEAGFKYRESIYK